MIKKYLKGFVRIYASINKVNKDTEKEEREEDNGNFTNIFNILIYEGKYIKNKREEYFVKT